MISLKSNSNFKGPPTEKPKKHPRLSGQMHNPMTAFLVGYRYATVGPKGNVISFHMTDRPQEDGAFYSLRKAGCKIVPLSTLLSNDRSRR